MKLKTQLFFRYWKTNFWWSSLELLDRRRYLKLSTLCNFKRRTNIQVYNCFFTKKNIGAM